MKLNIYISLVIVYLISQMKGEWMVDGIERWLVLAVLFGCTFVGLEEYRKIRKGDDNVDR